MYLTALVRILVIICFILISSPKRMLGSFGLAFAINLMPFLLARVCIILTRSFKTELSWYSTGIISILPASIFEKSKISLIIPKRLIPACLRFSAYSSVEGSFDSRKIISSIPSIALIGVLISWLIFDKNSLFVLLACNAINLSC